MAFKDQMNFKFIFGLLMVMIFLGMSFLLVFTNMFLNLPLPTRIITGAIFFVYGLFRGYRIWKSV